VAGKAVYCVWSGQRLRDDYDIDRCFPFAAWPSGDAWNLLPASKPINNQKSNRLVTQGALERADDINVDWSNGAFLSNGDAASHRLFMETAQTLPLLIEPRPVCRRIRTPTHQTALSEAFGWGQRYLSRNRPFAGCRAF
jgi:hypothetical protein